MDPKELQLPRREAITAPTSVPDRPVGWGLKDMLWASLVSLVLIVVALIGSMIVVMLLWILSGQLDLGALTSNPDPNNLFAPGQMATVAFLAIALEALLIPAVWFFGPRKHGGGWHKLGFRKLALGRSLLLVAGSLAVIMVINAGWEWLRQRLGWAGQGDVLGLFGEGIGGLLIALLAGGVVAPIAEEVFFRGFLYADMRDRWNVPAGIAVSSIIFGIVHFTPGVLLPIAVMGAIMAWLYEETDSLWAPIMLHAAVNSLGFLAMFLDQNLPV